MDVAPFLDHTTVMPLTKARRVSLAHTVSAQLARAIVAGDFPAGAPLQEIALAEQLGVSRAPVREALIELEMRGLVQFDPQGRTRVPTLTARDIHDIHAVRLAIDPLAASLAAEKASAESLAEMERILAATKSARTLADVCRLDAEFHDALMRAGENQRLVHCWSVIRDQVELWLAQMHLRNKAATAKIREVTIQSHRRLLEAIRSGEPEVAAEAGRRHIADWIRSMPAARPNRRA